ncbi:MAG: hypothetical protein QNK11_02740 [Legionella sp.]|nr:hypothetical protein [Legionella sp.]
MINYKQVISSVFVLFFVSMSAHASPITLLDEIFTNKDGPSADSYKKLFGESAAIATLNLTANGGAQNLTSIAFDGPSFTGMFTDSGCAGTRISSPSNIATGAFSFVDGANFFFGQAALSAISGADTSVHCIGMIITGGAESVVILNRNLTCNGTECNNSAANDICVISIQAPWTSTSTTCSPPPP